MELFDRNYASEFALFADVIASTKKPIGVPERFRQMLHD
jgi:hypothetical protein